MRRLPGSVALAVLLLLVPASAMAVQSSSFSGHWVAIDPLDGSNLDATFFGGSHVRILYTDDVATSACEGASTTAFTSLLVGTVDGNDLLSTMVVAKCGTQPLGFHGLQILWSIDVGDPGDPSDDVLTNSFGEEFSRAD